MKRICIILIIIICIGSGISIFNDKEVNISIDNSEWYSEREILEAMQTVEKYVERQTPMYYLKTLRYDETYNKEWNKGTYGYRTMILQSDYAKKSILKDEVYEEYEWHLRYDTKKHKWEIVNQGYC